MRSLWLIPLTILLLSANLVLAAKPAEKASTKLSSSSQTCLTCHAGGSITNGIVGQWKISSHANKGVGCFECHQADKGDSDGFEHNGFFISTIVSPKDCSRCHEKESKEFQESHHAEAAKILGSLDNYYQNQQLMNRLTPTTAATTYPSYQVPYTANIG